MCEELLSYQKRKNNPCLNLTHFVVKHVMSYTKSIVLDMKIFPTIFWLGSQIKLVLVDYSRQVHIPAPLGGATTVINPQNLL
jgi:hypothetical protein